MKYSLIAILLFSFTALQAQVKGTVKDNLGDPIAGANLFWQGTTQGTTTSAGGTTQLGATYHIFIHHTVAQLHGAQLTADHIHLAQFHPFGGRYFLLVQTQ